MKALDFQTKDAHVLLTHTTQENSLWIYKDLKSEREREREKTFDILHRIKSRNKMTLQMTQRAQYIHFYVIFGCFVILKRLKCSTIEPNFIFSMVR